MFATAVSILVPLLLVSSAASDPPRPSIVGPRTSERPAVTYRFRSPRRGVRFQCRLDAARFRSCRSPYRVRLKVGRHALRVRAIDRSGRTSPVATIRIRIVAPRQPETRVGSEPLDVIAVGDTVWSENYGDGTVSVVDTATRRETRIPIGGRPGGIAYGAGSVWVTDFSGGPLTRIEPATRRVVARIPVPNGQSAGVAVEGSTVYVADYGGGLTRVDATTNQVLGRTTVEGQAEAVAVGFGRVWVSNGNGTVSTHDPATGAMIGTPIAVGNDSDGLSVTGDSVWAVALYGKVLARIDPGSRRVVTRVATAGQASGVLATGDSVWVSFYDRATVARFDLSGRLQRTYRVGFQPRSVASAGGSIWVANQRSDSISRIRP